MFREEKYYETSEHHRNRIYHPERYPIRREEVSNLHIRKSEELCEKSKYSISSKK